MTYDHAIDPLIAGCRASTGDGIFVEPTNLPTGDTRDWTKEQRRIWWGRYYVAKRAEGVFDAYCFDGGCWDRATWRGDATTEQGAIDLIRRLAGRAA